MLLADIIPVLDQFKGVTFASLDSETSPAIGLKKMTTGESVILFNMREGKSGYEALVKRRLEQNGFDPDQFNVGPLPWGVRPFDDIPAIIKTEGMDKEPVFYLQTVRLNAGKSRYFLMDREISEFTATQAFPAAFKKKRGIPDALPPAKRVVVSTYALSSIKEIRLLGQTVS